MQRVRVRHIQVDSLELIQSLERELVAGVNFESLAQKYSTCPSGLRGGELDWLDPVSNRFFMGEKVIEGALVGPVQTEFGYHLIEVLEVETVTERVVS